MQGLDFLTFSGNLRPFGEVYLQDMEYFIKNLSVIKGKEVQPELIGSIITRYAAKWLPELGGDEVAAIACLQESPESLTASWTKKRFFVESLIAILPPEKDCVPCNFLLRLLRVASMVQVEPALQAELERRIASQLDQASLKELMIPCFSHTATTLLDVNLILRLARSFVRMEDVTKSGAPVMKLAKLVDSYLAEAAVDSCLTSPEFIELASAIPGHARTTDDGLYRAIDTYLKAHPGLPKQDRKTLCHLLDVRKLSLEASLHAARNDRLPVRAVIQVLLSEQSKIGGRHAAADYSGCLSGGRSPSAAALGLDLPGRCLSKREAGQQVEIRRLKEDVVRLQSQCAAMERKLDKLAPTAERKRGSAATPSSSYYFIWKRLGIPAFRGGGKVRERENEEEGEATAAVKAPAETKVRLLRGKSSNRRRPLS